MNIEIKKLAALKPAPYNPRNINKKDFNDLKNSIKEFGYVEPIIYNQATGYVVGGHQRLKALQELGIEEVECVIIDVPIEKEKALNIALNKISGEWDKDKLLSLLDELDDINFDITLTGFNLDVLNDYIPEVEADFQDGARERQYDLFKLYEYDASRTAGYYNFPVIKACHYVPDDLIGFKYIKPIVEMNKTEEFHRGVHFYMYDWEFERIWNEPYKNFEKIKKFSCTLTPDFSTYTDMPLAMQIWNMYRARLIGQMMQDYGLTVIPGLQWAEPETFKFCFDGIEQGGTVAVSTRGTTADKEAHKKWCAGMEAAIEKVRPETILIYGTPPKFDFKGINVKYIKAGRFR